MPVGTSATKTLNESAYIMNIGNIDRLLVFREDSAGYVLGLNQLQQRYGIDPDGTNFYYGINQANVDDSEGTACALNPTHRAFMDGLLAALQNSADDEKMLMLGVEPPGMSNPYTFVAAHIDLVERLADDLNQYQQQALKFGKRLNIVVRYASEMNDGDQSQGNNPTGFKSTFVQVRHAFTQRAPKVLLAFSPALRADLPEELIAQYWPGDQYVDIISGTWYIGAPSQTTASEANMRAYFIHRIGAGKGFGLDEVGGTNASGTANDAVLQRMLHDIEALQIQNVSFKYATLFLANKWGSDATLAFIRPSDQAVA